MKRNSLEGSVHTPMYTPNILPLTMESDLTIPLGHLIGLRLAESIKGKIV